MLKVYVAVLMFFFLRRDGFAQDAGFVTVKPYTLTIGYEQTSNIIFPYAIRSVDLGNAAVIVQKAKAVENILQLKAAKKDFVATNLSVVTGDGKFYSFVLRYSDHPVSLNISFASDEAAMFTEFPSNAWQLEREACRVLSMTACFGLHRRDQGLRLQLEGVFHSEKQLWLKLQLQNETLVDFEPASIRFFLRDKKRSKRTALHETEVCPLYMPAFKNIRGETTSVLPFGFKSFTVPKHQRLLIQIADESGGRTIVLPVKSRFFLEAGRLPL